ncbi:hypothetical protein V8F06_001824 [Rhypophila decipiens]
MASTINVLVGFATLLSLALLVAPEYASLAATYVAYLLFSAADILAATAPLVDSAIARVVVLPQEYDSVVTRLAMRLVFASPFFALACFVLIPGPLQVVLSQGAMFLRPVPVIFPVRDWIVRLGHCCQDFWCLDRQSFDCLVSKLYSTKAAWNNVRTQIETTSDRIRILCEQCRKVHQEWSQRSPAKAARTPPPTWNPCQLDTPKVIPAGTRPSNGFLSLFRGDWRLQPLQEQINVFDECRKNAHLVLAQLQEEEERYESLLDLFKTGWALSSRPVPIISPVDHQFRGVGIRPLERHHRVDSRSTFIVPETTPSPPDSPVLAITAPEAPAPEVITVDTCPVVTDEPSAAPAVVDHLPVVDVKPTAEKVAHPVIGTNVPELLSRSAYQLRYNNEMNQYQKERIDRLRRVQSQQLDACLRWERQDSTPVVEPKSVALRKLFSQRNTVEQLGESSVQEEHAPTQVEAQYQEDVCPVEESLPVVEDVEEEEEETKPVPAEPHSRRQEDEVPPLQEEVVTALPVAPEPEPLQEVETTVLEAAPAVAATAIPEEEEDEWEDVMDEDDEEEAADSLMSAIPEQTGGDGAGAAVLDAPPVPALDVQSPALSMDVEEPYQPGCAEEGAAAPAPAASWVLPQQQEFTFGLPQQQMPAFGLPQRQTFTFGQPQPQQQPSMFDLSPPSVPFLFAPPALDNVQLPAGFPMSDYAFGVSPQQQQPSAFTFGQQREEFAFELEVLANFELPADFMIGEPGQFAFVPDVPFPADWNLGDFGMEDVQTSSGEAAPVQPAFQPMDTQHPEPQMLEVAPVVITTTTNHLFANVTHAMDIDAPSFQRDARVIDEDEARWILEAVEAARLAEAPAANQHVPVPPVAQQAAVPEPVVAEQQEGSGVVEEPRERPPPFFPRPGHEGISISNDDDDSDDDDDDPIPGAGHVPGPRGLLKRSLDQAFDGREEQQRGIRPYALPALPPQPEEEMPEPEAEDRFAGHSAEDRHWLRQMEAEMVVERDHPGRVIANCRFAGASAQLVPENWDIDAGFDWNLRLANDPRDDDDVTDPDLYDSPADEEEDEESDEEDIEESDEERVDGGLADEDMVDDSDDGSDMESLFGAMDEEDN